MSRFTGVIIALLSAFSFYGTGHPVLFMLAVFTVMLCLWSCAALQEYSSNWVVPLNMVFTFMGAALLILGIIARFA